MQKMIQEQGKNIKTKQRTFRLPISLLNRLDRIMAMQDDLSPAHKTYKSKNGFVAIAIDKLCEEEEKKGGLWGI